jgi:hypothetical protein
MSIGKLFQSFVAATENERSPRVFLVLRVIGCNNRPEYERKLYLQRWNADNTKTFTRSFVLATKEFSSKEFAEEWGIRIARPKLYNCACVHLESWAKEWMGKGNSTELYIYLEQELQSFGVWEKWNQDGGNGPFPL